MCTSVRIFPSICRKANTESPKASSYFSLGCVRLERYVEIKKLLFIHSVLSRGDDDTTKMVFVQRAKKYFDNTELCSVNPHRSTVYDLLNSLYVWF